MKRVTISRERREAIIDEIAGILVRIHAGPVDQAALKSALCEQVIRLQNASRKFFSRRAIRETRDNARTIARTIDKLNKQIRDASPELRLRMKLDTSAIDKNGNRFPWDSLGTLKDELAELRRICQTAAESQKPDDEIKKWCARKSFLLVYWCIDRLPENGSDEAPLRQISRLLYEHVTGIADHDLRRACADLIARHRKAQIAAKDFADLWNTSQGK